MYILNGVRHPASTATRRSKEGDRRSLFVQQVWEGASRLAVAHIDSRRVPDRVISHCYIMY